MQLTAKSRFDNSSITTNKGNAIRAIRCFRAQNVRHSQALGAIVFSASDDVCRQIAAVLSFDVYTRNDGQRVATRNRA